MPLRTTLENFLNHVDTLEARRQQGDDLYDKEFQDLKSLTDSLRGVSQYSCSCGENELNRKKNRYKDILPYDYSRVVLPEIEGIPGSDYINASYIKGASGSRAYIASQGPLPQTVDDFWRMIWDCEVQVIVMASSEVEAGKQKCERYWVCEKEEKTFGNLKLKLVRKKQVCTDFVVRTMKLCHQEEERTIIQFHYVTWPDHGIPGSVTPILSMVRLIRDCQASETLPVLVHCSAGCGRTGTICAIDYVWGLLRAGKLNEDFNLFQLIADMRRQRIAMVQTKEQYILVHLAVKELFQQHLMIIDDHPYENVDFSGFPIGLRKELLDETADAKKGSDCSLNIAAQNGAETVPPLPEKKKNGAAVQDDGPRTPELGVKQLIHKWNNGKPNPVSDGSRSDTISDRSGSDEDGAPTRYADRADVGLHRGSSQSLTKGEIRERSGRSSSPSGSEDSSPTGDKAVIIRKPSIARLRAIFEKPSPGEEQNGSLNSEKGEQPLRKSSRSPENRNFSIKRNRSPFKRQVDSPEVVARYQDTALKVYSEIRHSEEQEKTEKQEKVPSAESPLKPEFLRRSSSRQNSRNVSSIWYDKDSEESLSCEDSLHKTEDKPTLPVKRSRSLKVQSITENAFGLFKLSPLRHRKNSVAAYLAVEEERHNGFHSSSKGGEGVSKVEDASTKSPAKLSSPRVYKRMLQKSEGTKEKSKLRYLLGENPTTIVPGFSGTSVQLVHIKNNIDEDVNKNVSVPSKAAADINSETNSNRCVEPVSNSNDVFVSETIVLPNKVSLLDDKNKETDKPVTGGEKLKHPLLEKEEFADDKPPPLPVKVNSPRNSPLVRRHRVESTAEVQTKLPTEDSYIINSQCDTDTCSPPLPPKMNSAQNSPVVQRHAAGRQGKVADDGKKQPAELEEKVDSDKRELESADSIDGIAKGEDAKTFGEDEECQKIIRDCQEYLMSSGYTAMFPAVTTSLSLMEESLQNYRQDELHDACLEDDEEKKCKPRGDHEGSPCSVYNNDDSYMDRSDAGETRTGKNRVSDFAQIPNAALDELLMTCKEYSDINDNSNNSLAVQYSFDEKTIDVEDYSLNDDVEPVSDDFNTLEQTALLDDAEESTVQPKKKSDYELLWLSESGTSAVVAEASQEMQQDGAPCQIEVKESTASEGNGCELQTSAMLCENEDFRLHLETCKSDCEISQNSTSINASFVSVQVTSDECVQITDEQNRNESSSGRDDAGQLWDLSSYKIVKEILQTKNAKDTEEKIYENVRNVGSDKTFETPVSENDLIKRAMFADGPPKPPRMYLEHKNRKPQPLPRTIRPSKADVKHKADLQNTAASEDQDGPHNACKAQENSSASEIKDAHKDLYSFPVKHQASSKPQRVNHVYEELDLPARIENDYAVIRPIDVPKRTKKRPERSHTSAVEHLYENCSIESKHKMKAAAGAFPMQSEREPKSDKSDAADHVYESIDTIGYSVQNDRCQDAADDSKPSAEQSTDCVDGENDSSAHMYSEVDKWKHKKWTRCLIEPLNADEFTCGSYSKDDLELQPVAPPRKRQSATMSRSLSEEVGVDPFWWTHTLPVRLSGSAQEQFLKQMSEWGDEWDSDDDCLPPVPAKTKAAYMLPEDSASSSSKSEQSLRETSPQASSETSELKPSRSFSKFSILTKLGLKSEAKPDGASIDFPNRLPKRPKGPRNPPSSWVISAPTSS